MALSSCERYLFSGARKDDDLYIWDLRSTARAMARLQRAVRTNQRIYFDLDWTGRFLVSGSHFGDVLLWDLPSLRVFGGRADPLDGSSSESRPMAYAGTVAYAAHGDCVNGVSMHPSCALLATASGQRHPRACFAASHDSGSGDSDSDGGEPGDAGAAAADVSLRLWHLPVAADLRRDALAASAAAPTPNAPS